MQCLIKRCNASFSVQHVRSCWPSRPCKHWGIQHGRNDKNEIGTGQHCTCIVAGPPDHVGPCGLAIDGQYPGPRERAGVESEGGVGRRSCGDEPRQHCPRPAQTHRPQAHQSQTHRSQVRSQVCSVFYFEGMRLDQRCRPSTEECSFQAQGQRPGSTGPIGSEPM